MNGIFNAINRIHLFTAFLVLLGAHLLLYYLLHTNDWIMVALSAALVDTAVLAAIQLFTSFRSKGRS